MKMKVSYCENCPYSERRVWSQYYKPNGYHAIGMNHAYKYCNFHKERCYRVKKCIRQSLQEIKEEVKNMKATDFVYKGPNTKTYTAHIDWCEGEEQ